MTYTVVKGNLFDAPADHVIGHGVNLQGVMGAGIAKTFRDMYPQMYLSYRSACDSKMLRLGTSYMYCNPEDDRVVANLATQQFAGKHAQLWAVSLAVSHAMNQIEVSSLDTPKTLAIPQVGCGIGGLEWNKVEPQLQREAEQSEGYVNLEVYVP